MLCYVGLPEGSYGQMNWGELLYNYSLLIALLQVKHGQTFETSSSSSQMF